MATCSIEGCPSIGRIKRGYCNKHYKRLLIHGDPNRVWVQKSTLTRFMLKVDPNGPGGCWLWTAGCFPNGYGKLNVNKRSCLAHRLAYELFIGPISDGLTIDHVKARGCRHRHCVNPAHLEPVTHTVNLHRGDTLTARNAAKTHCPKGHPYAGDNLMLRLDGSRRCRTCNRDRQRSAKSVAS